jgi:hypothetical protein
VEFIRSFFGGNRRHQKPFRNYLTFKVRGRIRKSGAADQDMNFLVQWMFLNCSTLKKTIFEKNGFLILLTYYLLSWQNFLFAELLVSKTVILSFKSVWNFKYFLDFSTQSNECFKNLSKEESSGEWRRSQDEGNFTPLL